jgi:hypothetical protein
MARTVTQKQNAASHSPQTLAAFAFLHAPQNQPENAPQLTDSQSLNTASEPLEGPEFPAPLCPPVKS